MHEDFPTPSISLPEPLPPSIDDESSLIKLEQPSSQDDALPNSQKENDAPGPAINQVSRSSLRKPSSPIQQHAIPDSQPSSITAPPGTLPPQLLSLLSAVQFTLKTTFSTAPPHTIQRLAELILRPTHHYRTLPSYLRAIDRVISVSSTADLFPLPSVNPGSTENGDTSNSGYLVSGASSTHRDNDFNGAALTRIPWLHEISSISTTAERALAGDLHTESTALIDGPNGAGSLETVTVSVNGVSSLSRDNGPVRSDLERAVPYNEPPHSGRMTRSSTAMARKGEEAMEEKVHARGPDEIGMEDMGPQATDRGAGNYDVEAALGRKGEGEKVEASTETAGERGDRDADGDVVIADADGKVEGEEGKADANGINVGADAVDSTAL